MSDPLNCPTCGFPNPEGAHACISCQAPIGRARAPAESAGAAAKLKPAIPPVAQRSAPSPTPIQLDDIPQTPEEILERIRQVRGEDATKSLEMLAFPELKDAVEADLAGAESRAQNPAPAPLSAAPSPAGIRPAPGPAPPGDPWVVDHHELRAIQASDPWKAQSSRYSTTGTASTRKAAADAGFRAIDLVSAAGVLAVIVSAVMPWISVYGGTEGQSLGPGSLPMSLLVKGVSESYPLPWLTATVVMIVLAVAAVLGLVFPRNQAAATGLTVAGMLAILIPAAFLVKLALSGGADLQEETAYVAAPGLYIAIGAALLLLLGAALRGPKARS